jgi:uncharacterized protein (TIGR02217 family)
MAFLESPRFPENISYHAVSGPEFQTDIIVVNSGYEQRNVNWDIARARFDVGHQGRTKAQTDQLRDFFRAVKGRAHGFRFKDWTDYQVTHSNGRVSKLPSLKYQLTRLYASGTLSDTRLIRKPVTAAFLRNGTPMIVGTNPGNYSLDTTTGIITMVPDVSRSIASITKANPGVITTTSAHGFTTGDQIDISTPSGMTELNGTFVTITVLSTTSFSIGVNTSTYSTYVGLGQVFKTIQPSETLTWAGEFDVPCRFDTDRMEMEIVDKDIYSWGQIPIVEIRV